MSADNSAVELTRTTLHRAAALGLLALLTLGACQPAVRATAPEPAPSTAAAASTSGSVPAPASPNGPTLESAPSPIRIHTVENQSTDTTGHPPGEARPHRGDLDAEPGPHHGANPDSDAPEEDDWLKNEGCS